METVFCIKVHQMSSGFSIFMPCKQLHPFNLESSAAYLSLH